jgi:hypothetical protein
MLYQKNLATLIPKTMLRLRDSFKKRIKQKKRSQLFWAATVIKNNCQIDLQQLAESGHPTSEADINKFIMIIIMRQNLMTLRKIVNDTGVLKRT